MTIHHEETRSLESQWQRLDEELVEEFGRWLSLLGKVFAISLIPIIALAFTGWL
jgi:hypothetical protein